MTEGASGQFEGNPYSALSIRFWAMWGLAQAGVVTAFAGAMYLLFPYMDGVAGVIAAGAAVILFTLALIAICMVPMRVLQKRGIEGKMRPAYRRYTLRFLPAMLGYVVVLLAATMYWNEAKPTGAVLWLLGIAPSLPLLLAIRAIVLLPREENDEYIRDCIYRSYAWGTGGALALCTVWGFLDLFEAVPHVQLWAVFPIWAVCMGLARLIPNERRA
jgi:hypothetical protein